MAEQWWWVDWDWDWEWEEGRDEDKEGRDWRLDCEEREDGGDDDGGLGVRSSRGKGGKGKWWESRSLFEWKSLTIVCNELLHRERERERSRCGLSGE